MGNSNISKEVRLDKVKRIFKKNHLIIKQDQFIAQNPGYYPPYDYVNEYHELYNNNISLCLNLLDGIDTNQKTLLDLGCGLGTSAYAYNKYLNLEKFYGIDIIEENIDFCKKNYNGVFNVMDFNNIEYEDNFFDIVTATDSLYGLIFDHDMFLNNIYRILKPNSTFINIDLDFGDKFAETYREIFDEVKMIDVSQNIILSLEKTIKNIDTLNFSKEKKDLILYGYEMNYKDAINGSRYTKYIGYKK